MRERDLYFYLCKRFMTDDYPEYIKFGGIQRNEIVSVDCSLFPYEKKKEYDKKHVLAPDEQVLAVIYLKYKKDIKNLLNLDGFEFCGFDLAEGGDEYYHCAGTSALTNCGNNSFEKVFTNKDLNKYGLIDSIEKAFKFKKLMPKFYPDEAHAYCAVFAIWRKIATIT